MSSPDTSQLLEQVHRQRERAAELERIGMRGWLEIGQFLDSPESFDIRASLADDTRLRLARVGGFGKPGEWTTLYVLAVEEMHPDVWNQERLWVAKERAVVNFREGEADNHISYIFAPDYRISTIDPDPGELSILRADAFVDRIKDKANPREPSKHEFSELISLAVFYTRNSEQAVPLTA